MIFRQLFDNVSSTYSYLIASRRGGEALIIDPVLEKVDRYIQLVNELDLRLVKAVDTHLHADHITGLGALRDRTHCITVMGEHSKVDVVSMRVADGDQLQIEGVDLDVLYTPGHTDDSYSFLMGDRVFTGDTLLIRGTGRIDFQNGDPRARSTARSRARCMRPIRICRRTSSPAACSTSLRPQPANAWCSIAPSASARPWRSRRRARRGSPPPSTSKAGSTPGKRPAA